MERPSHMHRASSPRFSRRLVTFGLAVGVQFAIIWAFTHGLGTTIIHYVGPLEMVPVVEPVQPREAPPLPKDIKPVFPVVVNPIIDIARPPVDSGITTRLAPPDNGGTTTSQPPVGPDRALAGITATHTSPPYPMMERRMGLEGKVVLRLTVLADGRVGKAEIVTSSGHETLDEAAEHWIIAHWAYKPALDKGVPTAAQTLASVTFSLKNDR